MKKGWEDVDEKTLQELKSGLEQSDVDHMAAAMDPDQIQEMLQRTAKGTVKQCISNATLVLKNDPKLQGLIRLNEFTEKLEVSEKAFWQRDGAAITDTDLAYIRQYLEDTYGITSEKNLDAALRIAANQNRYHPVQDYLNSLQWDGQPRIRNLLHHFLGADTSDLTFLITKVFLIGAILRVFRKGCKFEYMLCLVGDQGIGKSSFFRLLAVRDEWYTDDLKKLDDENVYRKLQGHWIIEMGEMIATANAKSVEEIKSFLSRMSDVYKVPYERYPKDRLRQCVFGGTTNMERFLPLDRSGNRRFLPVMTSEPDMEVHILDDEKASRAYIDQVWAEAMVLFRNHDYSMVFPKEMADAMQARLQEFMPEDTKVGMIQAYLDQSNDRYVCTRLLYENALHHEGHEPQIWELREISDIMNRSIHGWRKVKQHRYETYGRQNSWEKDDSFRQLDDGEMTPFS